MTELDPAPSAPGEAPRSGEHASEWRKREVGTALLNTAKLGGSLILTWGVGLGARLLIPRFLGPLEFGSLSFADAFAGTTFVLLGLGMETYIRKEIPVRPEHAGEFIGGLLAVRLAMVAFLFVGMEIALRAMHRDESVRRLVYIYGLANFFSIGGGTSGAFLHAVGRVNEMSVLSVVTKLIWAAGIVSTVVFRLESWVIAASVAVSEGVKSLALFVLARRHLGFRLHVDLRATRAVVLASMPFFLSGLAANVTNKIDVTILATMTNDKEVGWYGAASGIAGLTMFLTPLISWVLVPLFARAAAASQGELYTTVRRSSEFILTLTIPVSLMIVVGADFIVPLAFGRAFSPAAPALQVLTIAYGLMYVSIVAWCALTVLKHTWGVTAIMSSGLFVNPLCNVLLIGPFMRFAGHGGGGLACAWATLLTELVIVALLLRRLGRTAVDRRLLSSVAKSLLAALAVAAVDGFLLRPLAPLLRLSLDGLAYCVLVLVTGAVDVPGVVRWVKAALAQRKAGR